jgi:ferredoxin-type protein NapF
MKEHGRLQRLLIQLSCLLIAVLLLLSFLPWKFGSKFLAQSSPFVAICSSLTNRSLSLGMGIGLALAVLTLIRRRVFCRYICPAGLLMEGVSNTGLQKTSWWKKCPPLGLYAALLTVFAAAVGYPLLLWMDPLAIFSNAFSICGTGNFLDGVLACIGLGILLLVSLVTGALWCARICPLGGLQDLFASIRSLFKKRTECTLTQTNSMSAARRAFLLGAGGIGLGLWAKKIGNARTSAALLRPPGAVPEELFTGRCIRCGNCIQSCPSKIIHPDAGEAGLAGLLAPLISFDNNKYCLENCIACTQICPSGALQPLSLKQKSRYIIGEVLVDKSLCLLTLAKKECDACVKACPFDAIHIYWDEEYYVAYPVAEPGKCNGCGACEIACPTGIVKAVRVWKKIPDSAPSAPQSRMPA